MNTLTETRRFTNRIEFLNPAVGLNHLPTANYFFNRKNRFPVGGVTVQKFVPKPLVKL